MRNESGRAQRAHRRHLRNLLANFELTLAPGAIAAVQESTDLIRNRPPRQRMFDFANYSRSSGTNINARVFAGSSICAAPAVQCGNVMQRHQHMQCITPLHFSAAFRMTGGNINHYNAADSESHFKQAMKLFKSHELIKDLQVHAPRLANGTCKHSMLAGSFSPSNEPACEL